MGKLGPSVWAWTTTSPPGPLAQHLPTMVIWSQRRPANAKRATRELLPWWFGTCALYVVVLAVGTPGRSGDLGYWLPGALLVAAPLAVGAVRTRR